MAKKIGKTYEYRVSTPLCVYEMSEVICNNSRFNLQIRSLDIANSAFSTSGSCLVLMELEDEDTTSI